MPGRFHAFELAQVLILKTQPLQNRDEVGLVLATDGKINVVRESFTSRESAHRQTADESRMNVKLAAQSEDLL